MTVAQVPLGLMLGLRLLIPASGWVKGTLPSLKFEVSMQSPFFYFYFYFFMVLWTPPATVQTLEDAVLKDAGSASCLCQCPGHLTSDDTAQIPSTRGLKLKRVISTAGAPLWASSRRLDCELTPQLLP